MEPIFFDTLGFSGRPDSTYEYKYRACMWLNPGATTFNPLDIMGCNSVGAARARNAYGRSAAVVERFD